MSRRKTKPSRRRTAGTRRSSHKCVFLKHRATQEIRFSANILLFMRQYYLLSQAGTPDASAEQREPENGGLKRELEVLKPELQLVRAEVSAATFGF